MGGAPKQGNGLTRKWRGSIYLSLFKLIIGEESIETEVVELARSAQARNCHARRSEAASENRRLSTVYRGMVSQLLLSPDAARSLPLAGPQQHLNIHGDNLGNVVQFMEREHPGRFKTILEGIADKIPGIDRIDTEKTSDGRLLLRFNDKGFHESLLRPAGVRRHVERLFAYLLLLEDPTPHPFLCIEEPGEWLIP